MRYHGGYCSYETPGLSCHHSHDGMKTHEYIYEKREPPLDMSQYDECPRRSQLSQLQSSEVQTISMDELIKLGVSLQLTSLTIRNDGSRVYSVMDIDKSNMICLLTLHSDGIIDITTKDGRDFRLLHSSAKAASVMDTTIVSSPSKVSTRTPVFASHVNASRQCIWCDNFGYYYSECQEFQEAIRHGHIYLNEYNRIINTRSGEQLPLAIGRGGMKACL